MRDERCAVEVGIHPGPYWIINETGVQVCDRHKLQLQERYEYDDEKLVTFRPAEPQQ